MANASRDENRIPTLLGTLNTDGTTPVRVKVNATNHGLQVANGTTGTDYGTDNAVRDDNRVPVIMAVSDVDGVTPVPIYADSNGSLLLDNT